MTAPSKTCCTCHRDRRILSEIEKCDARCANCHRRVTVERGGWWRQAVYEKEGRRRVGR